jgi:hypothetical protein
MPEDHRRSKAEFPFAAAQALRQQHLSYQAIVDEIGWSMAQTRRYLLKEIPNNGITIDNMPIETIALTSPRQAHHSTEIRSVAQPYAEPAQVWDNPEDAKSVPFNLSLPRGLKHLLDAESTRTGLPASRIVQRLLMAALNGQAVGNE